MAMSRDQQQTPAVVARAAGSSSPSPRLRVHHTTLVPPSPPPPETSLSLTFLDVSWLHSMPVERLFIYRLGPDADVAAIISNLRESLHRALRTFYLLAGRVRLTPGTSDRFELHYRLGDAVSFTVVAFDDDDADADAHIDALAADEPGEVAKIAVLVPPVPGGGRLLAVQATLLPARRGLAIGVTVHPAACDGSGSTHFLHTWAAACRRGAEAPPPPVIDRTLLDDPSPLYDVLIQTVSSTEECEFVKMSADQLFATFALSKDNLKRVKDAVDDEAARHGVTPPRCSSLVATFGLVWSCYQRAKVGSGGGTEETPTMTFMGLTVGHGSRMNPPLPDKYFVNYVAPMFALAPTGEVASAGAGGLFSACAAVASSIDEAVRDIGTSSMEEWMDRIREVLPTGLLTVAGTPRFCIYDLDFGFGRPVKVVSNENVPRS